MGLNLLKTALLTGLAILPAVSHAEYSDSYMSRSMILMKEESAHPTKKVKLSIHCVSQAASSAPGGDRIAPVCKKADPDNASKVRSPAIKYSPVQKKHIKAMPEFVQKLPVWRIDPRDSLEANLMRWAKRSNWKLLWKAGNWLPNQPAEFHGGFRQAIADVVQAIGQQGGNLRAGFYSNHTLIITTGGGNQ